MNDTIEIINNTIKGMKEVANGQTDKSNSPDETKPTIRAIIKHISNLENFIKK